MSQRGKSNKAMAFPGDFIALGPKQGMPSGVKRGPEPMPSTSSAMQSSSKKPKSVAISAAGSASNMPLMHTHYSDRPGSWEHCAVENFDPSDLAKAVQAAEDAQDMERVVGLLCGAVKILRNQRANPDQLLYLSLMFLAKCKSYIFSSSEEVLEAFCSLLKRDVKESYKSKGNALVSVLAANVLMAAYQKETNWPEMFVRVFIDDAIGERVWVDHPDCKGFVSNIITAFNTKLPATQNLLSKAAGDGVGRDQCSSPPIGGGNSGPGSGSATPTRVTDEDSYQGLESGVPLNLEMKEILDVSVSPRYSGKQAIIEHLVMEVVREQLNRRQGTDNITRNFLKFLTSACGLPEVRLTIISKVEMWVMNPKLSRVAHDLIYTLAMNCNTHTQMDKDVIGHFTKMRFKNKPNINLYLHCAREISTAHPENLPTLVKQTIFNELSNARNTNNMNVLNVIFSTDGERAAKSLASVFIELLLQKDCYLRALRALLREIVRALRHDINLQVFCLQLMQEKPNDFIYKDFEFKERMFNSITDLISLSMFLGISPGVREAYSAYSRGESKDLSSLKFYLHQVARIQSDAMWWLYEVVPSTFKSCFVPPFPRNLHKLLFLIKQDEYCNIDGWPAESDRMLFFKITSELPLLQDTFIRIILIGISKTHPLNARDSIDLAEVLTKRAAALHPLETEEFQIMKMDMIEDLFEGLYKLSLYSFPDTISLPKDYIPPVLAVIPCYWTMFTILLLYCAHNPETVGRIAWESYPTLRAFMEMCVTNQFTFPPPTMASGEEADIMKTQELQICSKEKAEILTLERHLAAATNQPEPTEQTSLLLAQLITMNPKGPLRRPPPTVLDQLQKLNQSHKIGHLLCRSRNPDFLLDILSRQGTNQAMPWLADLVESSEGSFSVLPVQCLCEFLINSGGLIEEEDLKSKEGESAKTRKQKQLLLHLQNLLQSPESDKRACFETLDYFLRRLSSQQTQQRLQALKGLRLVLTPLKGEDRDEDDDEVMVVEEVGGKVRRPADQWLINHLPSLPCFSEFYPNISTALRHACQVENDPNAVGLYIQFLVNYAPRALPDFADLCLEMASIIVERSTILPAILPGTQCKAENADHTFLSMLNLFNQFMTTLISSDGVVYWNADNQSEMINVVFQHSGQRAVLHFFVVHAQIILLTYQPSDKNIFVGQQTMKFHNELMQLWFSPPPREGPACRAFLIETKEEAILIPDWLKLKMIRSESPVLVDAALRELEPHQLVLFIQSFGIPVNSMSKLLQALDHGVKTDLSAVSEAVMDKNYMGQLVAVQQRRGAKNGAVFAEALSLKLDPLASNQNLTQVEEQNRISKFSGGRLVEPVIPPRSTAIIPPNHVKNTLLHIFDVGSPSRMTFKEKQDAFRTLQKFLTSEMSSNAPMCPMIDATVKAMEQILKSDLRDSFSDALFARTSFSCGLLRLLLTAFTRNKMQDSAVARSMQTVYETLLQSSKPAKSSSPLCKLMKTFQTEILKSRDKMETRGTETDAGIETSFRQKVSQALSKNSTDQLVKDLGKMLLEEENQPSSGASMNQQSTLATSRAGLNIDWLEMLDPELMKVGHSLQQQMLFSKNKMFGQAKGKNKTERDCKSSSRPHLLTMLIHEGNWRSLRANVNNVLSKFDPLFDAGSVLDFLSACIHIPKLWIGRDTKHVPKHLQSHDVLDLSNAQLCNLIDYHLAECEGKSRSEAAHTFEKRMSTLIERCFSQRRKAVSLVMDHLIYAIEGRSSQQFSEENVRELMLQVYTKYPNSLLHLRSGLKAHLSWRRPDSSGYTSPVDTVSHTLLNALAATQPGRPWATHMIDFETCTRKVAASHPILFLRNFPMLAATLKGRTQYDFSFFRSRNHLMLYSIILGLIEVLRPHVFHPDLRKPLEESLQCYFEMLEVYYGRRDSFAWLIDRFIKFMNSYVEKDPEPAIKLIQEHGEVLMELQRTMPNLQSLKSLLSAVNINTVKGEIVSPAPLKSQESNADVARLRSALQVVNQDNVPEISAIMSELHSLSNNAPYNLDIVLSDLQVFLLHQNKHLRETAFSLVIRYLRQNPQAGSQVSEAFIQCLQSKDSNIVQTALEKLPDIAVLLQDELLTILEAVFMSGLYSNVNVVLPLSEAITMLNTESGY